MSLPRTARSPIASVTPLFVDRSVAGGRSLPDDAAVPTTTCFIATTPRSGSWLLAEILGNTGRLGEPHEYFRPDFVPLWSGEWNLDRPQNITQYIDAAIACTRSANGVFAAKVHWYQLVWLTKALATEAGLPPEPLVDLAGWFPDPRYVMLRRRDKARQAISYYRAATSGVWFATDDATRSPEVVECDFQQIRWFEDALVDQEARWHAYLRRHGIAPLEVWYEDVVANRGHTVERVLDFVGLPPNQDFALPPPRLRPQADTTSERLLRRYLAVRDGLAPKPDDLRWRDDIRRFVAGSATASAADGNP